MTVSGARRGEIIAAGADFLSVVLLTAAGSIAIFGGFSVGVGLTRITAHSSLRLLLIAAAVVALRHFLHPRPSLLRRIAAGVRALGQSPAVGAVMPVFLWSRAGIFLIGYLSLSTLGYPTDLSFRVSTNELANLPARWDAGWYIGLASHGYQYDRRYAGQQNVAFFPAYPMLLRAAGVFTGGHVDSVTERLRNPLRLVWTGALLNLAAFAVALMYLHRFVKERYGEDAAVASVAFAAAYPAAFIFNAPYTEGLFLLAAIATFHHFGRNDRAAAIWGMVAGLSRPNGFILSVPLLMMALGTLASPRLGAVVDRFNASQGRSPVASVFVALMPVAGMLAFSGYLYLSWGEPFLWAKLHAAWGRSYGVDHAFRPIEGIREHGIAGYSSIAGFELLHVLPFLLVVSLSIPIALRMGMAYGVLILLTVIPPLLAGGWLSMSRVTVVLFPVYAFLAVAVPAKHRSGIVILFAGMQALGAALFFTWRPFY